MCRSLFQRQEQVVDGGNGDTGGPHVQYEYKDKSILDDAITLIVHHMKRQTSRCHPLRN